MSRRLTLIELLLVVFILAAVAASAATLTDDVDVQARYDLTASRREQVRRAILGEAPAVSGFVADMGRLPTGLDELLQPGTLETWEFDPTYGAGAGWRGPYLSAQFKDGRPVFRDGWGNDWQLWPAIGGAGYTEKLDLVSLGRDGLSVASSELADQDFPAYPAGYDRDISDHLVLVPAASWRVSVPSWSLTVTLRNESATTFVTPLRLRLNVPKVGTTVDWSTSSVISAVVDPALLFAAEGGIPANQSRDVEFQFTLASPLLAGSWTLQVIEQAAATPVGPTQPSLPVVIRARSALPTSVPSSSAWIVAQ